MMVYFSNYPPCKRCASNNAPPTSRKLAADSSLLRNFLSGISLFMVGNAQKSHGAISVLYDGCPNEVPPFQFFNPNTEFSSDLDTCDFF